MSLTDEEDLECHVLDEMWVRLAVAVWQLSDVAHTPGLTGSSTWHSKVDTIQKDVDTLCRQMLDRRHFLSNKAVEEQQQVRR